MTLSMPLTGRARDLLRIVFISAAHEYSEDRNCTRWDGRLSSWLREEDRFVVMAYLCDGWPVMTGEWIEGGPEFVWEPVSVTERAQAHAILDALA